MDDEYPAGHFEMLMFDLQGADLARYEKVRAEERKAEAKLRAQRGEKGVGLSDLLTETVSEEDVYTQELAALTAAEEKRAQAAAEKRVGRVPPPTITATGDK